MKVKVFHANHPTFGMGEVQPKFPSEFTHVADVNVEIDYEKRVTLIIDRAYHLTNSIDTHWSNNEDVTALTENTRSSSVGDVFCIAGRYFRIEFIGHEEIVVPD